MTVGVLGLDLTDINLYQQYCYFVECITLGDVVFTTMPKDLVVEQSSISTLLRNEHRGIDLVDLPAAIFQRNGLESTMEITPS